MPRRKDTDPPTVEELERQAACSHLYSDSTTAFLFGRCMICGYDKESHDTVETLEK